MQRSISGKRLGLCALGVALTLCASCQRAKPQADERQTGQTAAQTPEARYVREPAVAGMFYPADKQALQAAVDKFLEQAKPPAALPGRVVGLIVPHAGYEFSGAVAAWAYKCLQGKSYDTVVILGPSHHVSHGGAAMSSADAWRTPLGEVPVDTALRAELASSKGPLAVNDVPHMTTTGEHCVEVQLPFLQTVLGEFRVLPITVCDFSPENCKAIGQALARALRGKNALLVASSDMSHYPAYDDANSCDEQMLQAIKTLDVDAVYKKDRELMDRGVPNLACTMCGLGPVVAVMVAARELGADKVVVLKHANSGDADPTTKGRCVGYGAVALCNSKVSEEGQTAEQSAAEQGEELSAKQRAELLAVARKTLEDVVSGKVPVPASSSDPALNRKRAVFVTLKEHGKLRGCIGSLEPTLPLIQDVQRRTIDAALHDPRFPPVTAAEVGEITIEISVLSPLRLCTNPEEIIPGKHGVCVVQGLASGVFLPQVATEQGWDRETLLCELCAHKAGIAPDAWKKGAKLYIFTAQVFGEEHD